MLRRSASRPVLLLCLLLLPLAACGDDSDAGPSDAGTAADSSVDGGAGDAGTPHPVTVRLLAVTDFHGRLLPPEGRTAGGMTYLASHLAALEAEQPNSLVVSAGDLIGASTLDSALLHDEPTIDAMDLVGLDVATVGNHEFDRPFEELQRLIDGGCHPVDGCADDEAPYDGASFELLGANVIEAASGEPALSPWTLREVDGVRVAFVGVTLEGTADIVYAPFVEGLRFEDEADTVNALVPAMQAEGATVIVVLMHQGLYGAGYEGCAGALGPAVEVIERLDPAVDVVFTGHTHEMVRCAYDDGPVVVQAGSWGEGIGLVDLTIDGSTGEVIGREHSIHTVQRDVETSAAMDEYLDWLGAIVGPLRDREIGRIETDVSNVPDGAGNVAAGYLVADAFVAETGADLGFTNQGGLRTTLAFAASGSEPEDGIVTYAEMFALIPFGNTVVTVTLTGAQLEAALEQQFTGPRTSFLQPSAELSYRWDTAAEPGDRIDPANVTVAGVPLDPDATYRVALNSFIAEGGGGFDVFVEGTDLTPGRVDVDVVIDYLGASSPYAPPALDRIGRL